MKKFIIWLLLIVPCLLMGEESLEKLSWLVGEWVDTDEDVEVSMNYAFEDNNHFLINKFTMETKERDKFEGRQIITWDPAKKIIRSWIFDSDGGFGQGQWVEKGGKWMVEYTQTLPNGQIATAVHIYKKVDNNSYTFESTGRMIDGEMIPDLDPITVVRKKI